MKKKVLVIVALICLVSLSLCLVACGKNKIPAEGSWEMDGESNVYGIFTPELKFTEDGRWNVYLASFGSMANGTWVFDGERRVGNLVLGNSKELPNTAQDGTVTCTPDGDGVYTITINVIGTNVDFKFLPPLTGNGLAVEEQQPTE